MRHTCSTSWGYCNKLYVTCVKRSMYTRWRNGNNYVNRDVDDAEACLIAQNADTNSFPVFFCCHHLRSIFPLLLQLIWAHSLLRKKNYKLRKVNCMYRCCCCCCCWWSQLCDWISIECYPLLLCVQLKWIRFKWREKFFFVQREKEIIIRVFVSYRLKLAHFLIWLWNGWFKETFLIYWNPFFVRKFLAYFWESVTQLCQTKNGIIRSKNANVLVVKWVNSREELT